MIEALFLIIFINVYVLVIFFKEHLMLNNSLILFILFIGIILAIIITVKSIKTIHDLKSGRFKDEWKQYFYKNLSDILLKSLIICIVLSLIFVNLYLIYLSASFFILIIYFITNLFLSIPVIAFYMD